MFSSIDRGLIDDRIACSYVIDSHRKINQLSINFFVPIAKENSTVNSMLPYILCDSCKAYPNNALLTTKLYELYGASLEATVDIIGLYQILGINLSFVDNRFSLNNDNIIVQCCSLLTELLIKPNFNKNGQFIYDNVDLVKAFLLDLIQSEYYEDKHLLIRYAQKMHNINIVESCYGSSEEVLIATPETLTDAYKSVLFNSNIEIFIIGADRDILNTINPFIDKMYRHRKSQPARVNYSSFYKPSKITDIQEYTEQVNLNISKLIIGFRIRETHNRYALWLLSIILGGAPFSKLFINLRIKKGVCYNCYMDYEPFSDIMFFVCDIEAKNKDKVQFEVIRTLELIKFKGITDSEIDSTKQFAKNKLLAFNQSNDTIKNWSILQILCNRNQMPIDNINCIENISKNQIIDAAFALSLNKIYFLDNR